MGFAHTFNVSENLLVVQIWGEMSYSEEAAAVSEILGKEDVKPGVRILVDRTQSKFMSDPADVRQHVGLVSQKVSPLGKPKVANVVSSDLDFGMIRMFEALAEDKVRHDFRVFRSVDEACEWIGVARADVRWPKFTADENAK